MAQQILPNASANVKEYMEKAWTEAKPVAESLPKPKAGRVARFFPTDECGTLIKVVMDEYSRKSQLPEQGSSLSHKPLSFKTGGLVIFPGKTATGRTTTVLIPLHVIGEVRIGETTVDADNYYNIFTECDMEIPEGGKLVALIVSHIGNAHMQPEK